MNEPSHEDTPVHVGVITESSPEARQQIADANSEARHLAASIPWEDGSARPRVVACLERFNEQKEAEDVGAAGWMLTAVQERISEGDFPDWEPLKIVADKAMANTSNFPLRKLSDGCKN